MALTSSWPGAADSFDADHDADAAEQIRIQLDKLYDFANKLQTYLGTTGQNVVQAQGGGKEKSNTNTAAGATPSINLANGNVHDVKLTAAATFTFTGATSGVACSFSLYLRQDATGGRTTTWPASVKWPGGVAPTLSTAANKVDLLVFTTLDGGTTWYGGLSALDLR